jgi:CubicO group peptidase (beta-lactamase class C family)
MAAIIEIVSGSSYNDYVRGAILFPLGLREAYFRDETVPGLALGYQTPPHDPEPTSSAPRSAWDHGAGDLMISVLDLHMAFKGLRSGKVLSRRAGRSCSILGRRRGTDGMCARTPGGVA